MSASRKLPTKEVTPMFAIKVSNNAIIASRKCGNCWLTSANAQRANQCCRVTALPNADTNNTIMGSNATPANNTSESRANPCTNDEAIG